MQLKWDEMKLETEIVICCGPGESCGIPDLSELHFPASLTFG